MDEVNVIKRNYHVKLDFLEPPKPRLPNFWPFFLAVLGMVALFLLIVNTAKAERLTASWYSVESLKKEGTWKNGKERRMADGKRFSDNNLTCACWMYRLGSVLRVTNIKTSKSVVVTVTDRTNRRFAKTRIDLSRRAFAEIANLEQGVLEVEVTLIK